MRHLELQGHCFNFLSPNEIKAPGGVSTGISSLDQYLFWHGIPKGALSAFCGEPGLGSTSLWIQVAAKITQRKKQASWVEDHSSKLNPWFLKKQNVSLKNLFWVSPPKDLKQKMWVLQELMSLDCFELIGCPLKEGIIKDHHILKLKKLARNHQVALVFLTERPWSHPHLSLSLGFQKEQITILRALHRPTPHRFKRRELYAHTLPEFISEREAIDGGKLSGI